VAAHLFYLEDARGLLDAGADLLAHSVRDREMDTAFISALKERGTCLSPTLVREVSTYVYAEEPSFFTDPFFLKHADSGVLAELRKPERQEAVRKSPAATRYREALAVARRNLKALADAGVPIAFGTDSGPPARFQGYFEHLELDQMVEAGLTPRQALLAATSVAARCVGLAGQVGTLEPGAWADFLVFREDPLVDVRRSRSLESVWIAGERLAPDEGS
jgi:imidazolonepropionase-like amidohydrolase